MPRILTADTIQTLSGAVLSSNWPSGMVVGGKIIRSDVRTSMPALSGAYTAFSGVYNKRFGASDSYLVVRSTVFGAGRYSGNCGVGHVCDGNWDFGVGYQYDGAWTDQQSITVIGHSVFTGIAAGNRTIGWGWNPNDGSTNRPFNNLNPNSSDDPRNSQMSSVVIVQEVIL